jgi:hypothetical protein
MGRSGVVLQLPAVVMLLITTSGFTFAKNLA